MKNIIDEIADEKLADFNDKLIDKLSELNKQINRRLFYQLIVGLLFFAVIKLNLTTYDFGSFKISDKRVLIEALPVLFSFFFLDMVILWRHIVDVSILCDVATMKVYLKNFDLINHDFGTKKDPNEHIIFRAIKPFGYSTEFWHFRDKKNSIRPGYFYGLDMLRFMSYMLICLLFLLTSWRELYLNYSNDEGRLFLFLSIALFSSSFIYLFSSRKSL